MPCVVAMDLVIDCECITAIAHGYSFSMLVKLVCTISFPTVTSL